MDVRNLLGLGVLRYQVEIESCAVLDTSIYCSRQRKGQSNDISKDVECGSVGEVNMRDIHAELLSTGHHWPEGTKSSL